MKIVRYRLNTYVIDKPYVRDIHTELRDIKQFFL